MNQSNERVRSHEIHDESRRPEPTEPTKEFDFASIRTINGSCSVFGYKKQSIPCVTVVDFSYLRLWMLNHCVVVFSFALGVRFFCVTADWHFFLLQLFLSDVGYLFVL